MRIVIKENKKETGKWTADYIWNKIEAFGPTPQKPFVLGLPTGSSPLPVYKEWVRRYQAGEISFKNVVTFNMDEYVKIPEDHPEVIMLSCTTTCLITSISLRKILIFWMGMQRIWTRYARTTKKNPILRGH
jgi:6-phosphogluconolactonase/glucosamine-6-phosphate isomerase/deaminase